MYANGGPGPLCRKGERRIAYRPKTDIFLGKRKRFSLENFVLTKTIFRFIAV